MRSLDILLATSIALLGASSVVAQLPVPPMASAPRQADAYLFHAGAGDIFEITTSMMAQKKAKNAEVRAFASMLIDHHTKLTNQALATAASAGIAPPPPELSLMQKQMIAQLDASGPQFDRVFMQQQLEAHQQALALQTGYASNGDVPALQANASAGLPVIRGHLGQIEQLIQQVR